MPFSTPQQEDNSWKAPRGQDKEKLASVGLTGKLNLDSTWNSQEVQHEIRSLFQTTFCADGEEFVFSFLQEHDSPSKETLSFLSSTNSLTHQINLENDVQQLEQEHDSPSKETLSFLSSTNSLTHQINLENDVQQLEQNVQHHRTPVVSAERSPESVIAELCSSVLADGVQNVKSSLQLNIFAESLINTIAGINQWFVEDVADETVQSKLKEILDYRGRRDWTGDPVVEKTSAF
ncbi:UNVERIFIED_CONTAM: hypothetical protein FKN15_029090 [Acipenser sinensis]